MAEEVAAAAEKYRPLEELLKKGQECDPEEAAKAVAELEDAVATASRALDIEWNTDANSAQAECVRMWMALRATLPQPEPPADEDARKQWDKDEQSARIQRTQDARRFVMDYARKRKHTSMLDRCPRCEGRGDVRDKFGAGSKGKCTHCRGSCVVPNRRGVLETHLMVFSPIYRADAARQRAALSVLRDAEMRADRTGPFVRTLSIADVEDHDVWMRIRTKEQTYREPTATRFDKTEGVYTLYRVGRVWFLYTAFDRGVIDIPEPEAPEKSEKSEKSE
jgi:hypothetical protein